MPLPNVYEWKMDRIIRNVFHHDAKNIGDRASGPTDYFFPKLGLKKNLKRLDLSEEKIVFGGGSLFSQVEGFIDDVRPNQTLVAWGLGIPERGFNDEAVNRVASKFELFGTRNFDWSDQLDYVPCASCMLPVFDQIKAPTTDIVIFAHRRKVQDLYCPEEFPLLTNDCDNIEEAVDFISQGQTVVTSSYHGVYWAQLMGRKVVCVPYGSKFNTFKQQPIFAQADSWTNTMGTVQIHSPTLDECRSLNRKFAAKVKQLWDLY